MKILSTNKICCSERCGRKTTIDKYTISSKSASLLYLNNYFTKSYKFAIIASLPIFIILFLSIVQDPVQAQETNFANDSSKIYRFTLNDALEYAKLHNYQNRRSIKDVEIAKKQIWETTAIGLPQISANANYQNMLKIPTQLIPGDFVGQPGTFIPIKFGQQHDFSADITATQLIFSGEYIVGLQASKIFLKLSQQSYNKSIKTIKEMLTKSYYLLLIAIESKKIVAETGKNIENLLREVKESNKVGFVEETDVDRLQLTKQNNDNTIISLNNQIELSRRLIKYQLGLNYNDSLILVDSLSKFVDNLNADEILYKQFELSKNVDYQLIETQEQLAILNTKREKSAFLPQLSAFFTHSQSTYSDDFKNLADKWYPATIFGLKLSIPIISSGSRVSKVQQKNLEIEKIKLQKLELEQSMLLKVEQAKINFINAKNSFTNQKINLNLAKKISQNTETKYKKGVASSNELMIAQNQYLSTLSQYYQSLNNLLDAEATLEYLLVED